MLKQMKRLWTIAASFFKPQNKKLLLLAGDTQRLDLTGLTREQIKALAKKDDHLASYRTWPDAYYILVGTVAGKEGKVFYQFKDPVSEKEFVMEREVVDIMLYHDVIKR